MDVSKNRGFSPKMDGENNGKPYEQMDDLRVPLFLETPIYVFFWIVLRKEPIPGNSAGDLFGMVKT